MDTAQWHRWWKNTGRHALTDLLWEEWDPIGLRSADAPRDEYSSYVGGVATALRRGDSVLRIACDLHRARTRHMSLPPNPLRDFRAARRAKRWYESEWPAR